VHVFFGVPGETVHPCPIVHPGRDSRPGVPG
jgi:hypothetical protein